MAEETSSQLMKLWMIRHGEPEASARGRCYGSLDFGLSVEGKHQIQAVASALSGEKWAAIYTSPRRRCLQSARILAAAHCCPIEAIDALAEIDFGEFEGRTYDEIAIRYPDLYRQWMERPTEICFPQGESFEAMWTRVTEAASAIRTRHMGQSIAFVTHGGVIRILIAEVLGVPRSHIFRIAQRYGALNLISYFENSSVVEVLNYSPGSN